LSTKKPSLFSRFYVIIRSRTGGCIHSGYTGFEEADMTVVREKIKAKNGVLHMNLPDEFKDKMVEVVVKIESAIEKKLMIDTIKIDTTKWKFNRDEIYG
jgi:hypothetical protein